MTKRKATEIDTDEDEIMKFLVEKETSELSLYGFTMCQIRGIQHYSANAKHHEWLLLHREPNNQYDSNAIRVNTEEGEQIGHIDKDCAKMIRPILDGEEVVFNKMSCQCFTLDTPDKYSIQSIVVFFGPEETKSDICEKIDCMTSFFEYITEECPSCKKQVTSEQISKCYECYNVGCNDECDFDSEGNCVTCLDEETAWEYYDKKMNKIISLKDSAKGDLISKYEKLIDTMQEWKTKVEELEDGIVCHGYEKRDASDIMTDCGQSVVFEADWFESAAKEISGEKKN